MRPRGRRVTALLAFAIVAALATLTVAGLMVARQTARDAERPSTACARSAPRGRSSRCGRWPRCCWRPLRGSSGRWSWRSRCHRSGRSAPFGRSTPSPGPSLPDRGRCSRSPWPSRLARRGGDRGARGGPVGVAARPTVEPRVRDGSDRVARLVARRWPVAVAPAWVRRSTAGAPAPASPPCSAAWSPPPWRPPRIVFGASLSDARRRTGGVRLAVGHHGHHRAAATATPCRTWWTSGWRRRTCAMTSSTTPSSASTRRWCSRATPSPVIFAVDGRRRHGDCRCSRVACPSSRRGAARPAHRRGRRPRRSATAPRSRSEELGEIEIEVVGIGVLPSLGPFVRRPDGSGHRRLHRRPRGPDETFTPSLTGDPAARRRRSEPTSSTGSARTCRRGVGCPSRR